MDKVAYPSSTEEDIEGQIQQLYEADGRRPPENIYGQVV
mgnify:CR=1 FL=1